MKLIDIMPIDKWIEIEKEIHQRSGLHAAVYDENGFRITDYKAWPNKLCPALRATAKGQKFICAVAHQNMAFQAEKAGKTIVDECDAGLMKFVVPISINGDFLGTAGGCGLLRNHNQVDTYLVHRMTDLKEDDVRQLSADIDPIRPDKLTDVIDFVENAVQSALP